MKTIIILSLFLLILGCGKNIDVDFDVDNKKFNYKLPFERGSILKEDGKIKIRLSFYRPNKIFTKDTNERLHIYISGDEKTLEQGSSANRTKIFFIRVQVRPSYGYMNIEDLQIINIKTKKPKISGILISKIICPLRDNSRRIHLSFQDLPLVSVDSIDEMNKYDTEYYKKILTERFRDEWK